jgi:SAM-dependent methyltransferase
MKPGRSGSVSDEMILKQATGTVTIRDLEDGRRHVSVEPASKNAFVARSEWVTRYPLELIEHVLEVKGINGLCDEIARDESDTYVARYLRHAILSYLPPEAFAGKRLLDFGCGAGSSTMVLSRMLPQTALVGVELNANLVELARHRARALGTANVRFEVSPDPESLPPDLGTFDFLVLSAVWEHLLPQERRSTLMPRLWRTLQTGGVLFLNQTPHRWYPVEGHTTGLPLLNYAPAHLAHWATKRFSPKPKHRNESWEQLLRRGIRGGTAREVMRILAGLDGGKPVLLQPSRLDAEDPVDIWYAYSQGNAPMPIKAWMRSAFKVISRTTGSTFAPGIDLAIAKMESGT